MSLKIRYPILHGNVYLVVFSAREQTIAVSNSGHAVWPSFQGRIVSVEILKESAAGLWSRELPRRSSSSNTTDDKEGSLFQS